MKAFVISLSKIPSSFESATKVHKQLLDYGFDAELFEGTYGSEAIFKFSEDKRRLATYGIKNVEIPVAEFKKQHPEVVLPPHVVSVTQRGLLDHTATKMLRPGVIGCFYSHYRLWKKCVELNEPIFIFEDDVIFVRGYIPVTWTDVLMVCTGKEAYKHEYYRPFIEDPSGPAVALPLRNTSMPGAVGYGLTPAGAKKLVTAYETEFMPADTAMNAYVVTLEFHSHLMGRAALHDDGKVSLTATRFWNTPQ